MNRQGKLIQNLDDTTSVSGGIEWTKTVHKDGRETSGYTANPVGGCQHGCRWQMPDGTVAICYAKTVAEGVASSAYPQGFAHHYWRPSELNKILALKEPARIFIDSMSDLMGHWVPAEQIQQVIDTMRQAHWHTFLCLTKNAPRLLRFDWLPNAHLGFSSAPDWMQGNRLDRQQQERYMRTGLRVMQELRSMGVSVTWCSFEPLSWDVAPIVADFPDALNWAVIGAASRGRNMFQPEPDHVQRLLDVLDAQDVPVFFKGNLQWTLWREEFPASIYKAAS